MSELIQQIDTSFILWDYLKKSNRPIFLYGMGDGAVKLLRIMEKREISCKEIFASDSFVRDKTFQGFKIKKLSEIENQYTDPIILLSFASSRPDVISLIKDVAARHELYAPDINVFGDCTEVFDRQFLSINYHRLNAVYNKFRDGDSKKIFAALINFKLSGKLCFLEEMWYYSKNIPFDNDSKITSFTDLGAYNGDTALEAYNTFPCLKKITAVEPDVKNFSKLQRRLSDISSNIELQLVNAASWDKTELLTIEMGGGRNSSVANISAKATGMNVKNKKYISVSAESLDNILDGNGTDLIKFDVEGSEYRALCGCRYTLNEFHPKLIISVYHNNRDLFELSELLDEICPGYDIKIRFPYSYIPAWETRLYCEFTE